MAKKEQKQSPVCVVNNSYGETECFTKECSKNCNGFVEDDKSTVLTYTFACKTIKEFEFLATLLRKWVKYKEGKGR